MTERKETILTIALQLFAEQGYENTPTSQIAKQAGVSEGLIFRHFESKEGLLKALLAEGQTRLKGYVDAIINEPDYIKRIALVIELGPLLVRRERSFWKLQFTLKFKSALYAKLKNEQAEFVALFRTGVEAFAKLGYADPEHETYLLMLLLEGLTGQMLTQGDEYDPAPVVAFIKSKYGI